MKDILKKLHINSNIIETAGDIIFHILVQIHTEGLAALKSDFNDSTSIGFYTNTSIELLKNGYEQSSINLFLELAYLKLEQHPLSSDEKKIIMIIKHMIPYIQYMDKDYIIEFFLRSEYPHSRLLEHRKRLDK